MRQPARNAALIQLAAEIPAAVRWATVDARDWASCTALRAQATGRPGHPVRVMS
jgi:hypothetical protein